MKRRNFLKGTALLTALGLGGGTAAMAISSSRNRYYGGPASDHFDGTRFFNPGGTPPSGFSDLLKWQFGGTRAKWPEQVPVAASKPAALADDLTITMVGHATMLIQMAGVNILTDPVWSDRASPLAFAGPKRVAAPGIAFADLPRIDAILLSHNHYDHLDLTTLASLHAAHAPQIITPLGNDAIIRSTIPDAKITVAIGGM